MEIRQLSEYTGDLIDTALKNRDIKDLKLFLKPDHSQDSDPLKFTNAHLGHAMLDRHLNNKSTIAIVVDSDGDGYTSAAAMYNYILRHDPTADIRYAVHDCKGHGLTPQILEVLNVIEPDLVIVPDAGSNDVEGINALTEKDIDVMIIDHHVISEEAESGLIINNQVCEFTNSGLVGAGVVYKFIQGFDIYKGTNFADDYLDLVTVGQVGDVSDISDIEIRRIVLTGLREMKNKFLKEAINQKLGIGVKVTAKDLSFNVLPMINAVTRVGTLEERSLLFEALAGIGEDRVFNVTKRRKNKDTGKFDQIDFSLNIYQHAYDVAIKAKSRQDSAVKKVMANLGDTIVDDTGIIIAVSNDLGNPGISGLIANKLTSKFGKPALLLNEHADYFSGSGRGVDKIIPDFRKWCEDSGLFEFARGHDNAFGVKLDKDKLEALREYAKDVKPVDPIYYVDYLADKPDAKDCKLVYQNLRLFGGKVTEPFIGIKGMSVPKRFISIKGNMMTIYSYGVKLVQFAVTDELKDRIFTTDEDSFIIDVVGYYSMNNWGGVLNPQLIIKDIEFREQEIEVEEEVTVENIVF